ncbi:IS3 family transposase, partial [Streptomyces sp. NPDC059165]
ADGTRRVHLITADEAARACPSCGVIASRVKGPANAAAESFFGLLEAEIGITVWGSRQAARADVFRFIEVEYNRTRLRRHPEHGYLTPLENRILLQRDLTPAA